MFCPLLFERQIVLELFIPQLKHCSRIGWLHVIAQWSNEALTWRSHGGGRENLKRFQTELICHSLTKKWDPVRGTLPFYIASTSMHHLWKRNKPMKSCWTYVLSVSQDNFWIEPNMLFNNLKEFYFFN